MLYLPKPKRNKMELYYDILNAIATEITMEYEVKPTRVQLRSNLAYDKLARYLDELKIKGMIVQDPLQITEKGRYFLHDYDRIANFVMEMGIRYLGSSNVEKNDNVEKVEKVEERIKEQ
jgi:predicted transcriptional regulator